jgi:hypothetical protein
MCSGTAGWELVPQLEKDMVDESYYVDEQDGMTIAGAVLVVGSKGSSINWRLTKWGLMEEVGKERKDTAGSSLERMMMVDESDYLEQESYHL